jgi:hypothetical protein
MTPLEWLLLILIAALIIVDSRLASRWLYKCPSCWQEFSGGDGEICGECLEKKVKK